jgi:hypothetical protein
VFEECDGVAVLFGGVWIFDSDVDGDAVEERQKVLSGCQLDGASGELLFVVVSNVEDCGDEIGEVGVVVKVVGVDEVGYFLVDAEEEET